MPDATIFYVSYGALWVLVVFQSLVMLELVRQVSGDDKQSPQPISTIAETAMLPTGSVAPEFRLAEMGTNRWVSRDSLRGTSVLLAFTSPNCATCYKVADELSAFQAATNARLVVICQGEAPNCESFAEKHFPDALALHDETGVVAEAFLVEHTPTAVLLDPSSLILRYGTPTSEVRLGLDYPDVDARSSAEPGSNGRRTLHAHQPTAPMNTSTS